MNTPPRNILIVRLSAIGDIVMASGLIASFRAAYPEANISWLCEPAGATLLNSNPHLHEVILWPRKRWLEIYKTQGLVACLKAVWDFRKQLKNRHFDLAVDAQGLLKSGVLTGFSGAKRRVGVNSKEGGQLFMTETVSCSWHPDISSEYKFLAKHITGTDQFFSHSLVMSEDDVERAKTASKSVTKSGSYLVLCPFTTRPQKHWLQDHWLQLALSLYQEYRKPMIVLGGPEDAENAALMADRNAHLFTLAGQTSLPVASEIIRGAAGLVGVDTGLTHMGIAHGVPTLALFGSTLPYENTGTDNGRVLSLRLPCGPCKRAPTCDGRFDCMKDLTPDMVMRAAKGLF